MFDDIALRNRKHKDNDNFRRHENGGQGEGARSYENYDSLGLDHELSRCHLTSQRPVCILVKFGAFFFSPQASPEGQKKTPNLTWPTMADISFLTFCLKQKIFLL